MKTLTATATNSQPNSPQSLNEQFAHLTSILGVRDYKQVNKISKGNLVIELKKNFPGVKFSIVKRNYSTYDVTWTDGPTSKQVEAITELFVDSESSYCGDFRDPAPTVFNKNFGGFKYVFTYREMSEAVKALFPACEEIMNRVDGARFNAAHDLHRQLYNKQSFPLKFESCVIVRSNESCGLIQELYSIEIK
jgi:hypothetical protein